MQLNKDMDSVLLGHFQLNCWCLKCFPLFPSRIADICGPAVYIGNDYRNSLFPSPSPLEKSWMVSWPVFFLGLWLWLWFLWDHIWYRIRDLWSAIFTKPMICIQLRFDKSVRFRNCFGFLNPTLYSFCHLGEIVCQLID